MIDIDEEMKRFRKALADHDEEAGIDSLANIVTSLAKDFRRIAEAAERIARTSP